MDSQTTRYQPGGARQGPGRLLGDDRRIRLAPPANDNRPSLVRRLITGFSLLLALTGALILTGMLLG